MGRLRSLISKDLVYATRENILIYSLLFPLVFALAFKLFLPSVENMEMTFALDRSVPEETAESLRAYGRVERFEDQEAMKERVLRFDDVPGIYFDGTEYVVVLEGNEDDYAKDLPGVIIDYVERGQNPILIESKTLGLSTSMAREYGVILLALTCIAIGGLAIGLSIVDDRESRTMRALSVSPVKTAQYLAAKSVFGLTSSFVLALASTAIILGRNMDYLRLIPALVISLLWGMATGFGMGYICPNQLTAVAVLKLMAIGLLGIPVAAPFVPEHFRWTLYPFPNYWSFEAMRRIVMDDGLSTLQPNLIAAALGLVVLALIFQPLKRKFHM